MPKFSAFSAAAKRPLKETEFVAALSRCMVTYKEDDKKFRAFTGDITGLSTRREEIIAKKKGDDGGGRLDIAGDGVVSNPIQEASEKTTVV